MKLTVTFNGFMRNKIVRLEESIRGLPQVELPVTHHFSKGLYARELFIPKGSVLVGKIHKEQNLNIISSGDISVLTDDGVMRLTAPSTIVSPPGTKRVGYAHEDTVWITIHATEETDLEKIERQVIAQTFQEFLDYTKSLKLEG
ncbi:hypothetical protein [Glaciimonas immobilis]|uniref:Uncharacterized protein n=1 Tax=Glaciimonas immobilis TaxID=728004 RepID=A0A840RSY7_9BURK|nr:hypothetical protein [Glaciimonas immobilis]KAF3997551.1 hypothetical protein HAV38_12800 [Glaciimonas immobilis]MBB5200763.1 hypothetical protein [Glaciimonas immobilis]